MIDPRRQDGFEAAIAALQQHKAALGNALKGRFVQIFLALKFFQGSIPGMRSGQFIAVGPLQDLLDDLYAKALRPTNQQVLSIFEGNYLARTGQIGLGNTVAQNTWRNNLNLQKGIGCYASVDELADQPFLDQPRHECAHLNLAQTGEFRGSTCQLCATGAEYRNEEHRKWLRIDPDGGGYATTDLENIANFLPYIAPGGSRIPLWPLIAVLYFDADPGLSIGGRVQVERRHFMADFHFSEEEMAAYFNEDPTFPLNVAVLALQGEQLPVFAPPPIAVELPPVEVPGTEVQPPDVNTGHEAEVYVLAALRQAGWNAILVSRQALGYDIHATLGRRQLFVEVKSSLNACFPTLTAREWQKAREYQAAYILAVVENFDPNGTNIIHWVSNPANRLQATEQTLISYTISRSAWSAAKAALSDL